MTYMFQCSYVTQFASCQNHTAKFEPRRHWRVIITVYKKYVQIGRGQEGKQQQIYGGWGCFWRYRRPYFVGPHSRDDFWSTVVVISGPAFDPKWIYCVLIRDKNKLDGFESNYESWGCFKKLILILIDGNTWIKLFWERIVKKYFCVFT